MSSIGPQIPAHLLQQLNSTNDDNDDDNDGPQPAIGPTIGPQIPTHFQSKGSTVQVFDDDDDDNEDDGTQPPAHSIGPTIPQNMRNTGPSMPSTVSRPVAGPSLPPSSSSSVPNTSKTQGPRTIGPSLPSYASTYNPNANYEVEDEDSDDDIGPKPLPAGVQHQQPDAVQEFLEREEKRRKLAEEAAKPKAPKRDEWMLVPPTSQGLLGNLDTTKLKARQFSRGTASSSTSSANDNSLWTETPAERQQRLADEVAGKKRRVTDAPVDNEGEDVKAAKRRRKQEEAAIRKGVEEHTRKQRGTALVDQHATTTKKTSDEPPAIWDHSRDMGLGGRLMDDDKRNKMLQEAKGLGDRFGSGKSGGFL